MPSLRKQKNSPYWTACYIGPDGRRVQKSTKCRDKTEAMKVAIAFEEAAKKGRAARLTEAQARKVISEIYESVNEHELKHATVESYLLDFAKRKENELKESTSNRYGYAITTALTELGAKKRRELAHLTMRDIEDMRDRVSKKLSASSANLVVKVLRIAMNQAKREGLLEINEATRVSLMRTEKTPRRPFTDEELRALVAVADDEWLGMIMTGYYTALRLGDICSLDWDSGAIDLNRGEFNIVTGKTGRRQIIPIAGPLLNWLKMRPAKVGPVFPRAYESKMQNGQVGTISNWFHDLMVKAKLVEPRSHKKKKAGRDAPRQSLPLSFHCLRHTTTSLLKRAGVSNAIAMDIVGHESEEISRNYTHIDTDTKRKALNLLPDISKE